MAKSSILSSRLQRFMAMDRAEVAERLRQHVSARRDLIRYRLGHDFTQAHWSAPDAIETGHFFFTPSELRSNLNLIKNELPDQAQEIVSRARRILEHRFDLLGYENLEYGARIDWHLDAVHGRRAKKIPWFKVRYLDYEEVGDAKITWELNRHQHFVVLAKAYLLTEDQAFAREIILQWENWWEENLYPIGLNWASTLEVGFRVQAWIWTFFLLRDCPLFTAELRRKWIARLHLCGRHIERYLSTYFSPNTHLLGEALALFFLGTLFPSSSSVKWREKGWQILLQEAGKQIREDGFYFEQSTYYHVYALDIFLHARILASLNGIPIPEQFENALRDMLESLFVLGRAGLPHMFGDDDGGRLFDGRRNCAVHMLDPLATGAILFRRGDFKSVVRTLPEETLWLLGAKSLAEFKLIETEEPRAESKTLVESGLYLMFDAAAKQQLLIDAGPLGSGNGGHGHADALSVSLIRNGRELLRDSGTFEYIGPGSERSRFRGTGAHNTVRIDGRDQSEITGPFSWRGFPQVCVERWINGKRFDLFVGSHDGYSRPHSPVLHRRHVFHPREGVWLVRDVVQGEGQHQIEVAWHLGAGLFPQAGTENVFSSIFSDDKSGLAVLTPESAGWSRTVCDDSWSPVYGKIEPARVVRYAGEFALPVEFVTLLVAGDHAEQRSSRLVKVNLAGNAASAYRYFDDRWESTFVFGRENSPWQVGPWSSDAEFVSSSFDLESGERCFVICGGSFVDDRGMQVLSCSRRISYAEVWSCEGKTEISSSDLQAVTLSQSLDLLRFEEEVTPSKAQE